MPENQLIPFVNIIQERLEKTFENQSRPSSRVNTMAVTQIGFIIHSWLINPEKESLQKVINDLDHLTN
jgi:hypothetical protein